MQCRHCGSIGIEFGTSYLTFSESDFFTFAAWFESVDWKQEHIERGRVRIRVRDESSLFLSLTREELHSVGALLAEGMLWAANHGPVTKRTSLGSIPMGTGATVH